MAMRLCLIVLGFILCTSARAFDVAEFKSGMSREQVREHLTGWRFDRVQNSGDTLLAYDLPERNSFRQFRFQFCNDKLVGLEQSMKASVRNFIVISNNYITTYGQPIRVSTGVNVVASGEKNAMVLHWRRGNETVAVRYQQLGDSEQLALIYEMPNTCWQSPRMP
jgi:hypothetical protein